MGGRLRLSRGARLEIFYYRIHSEKRMKTCGGEVYVFIFPRFAKTFEEGLFEKGKLISPI